MDENEQSLKELYEMELSMDEEMVLMKCSICTHKGLMGSHIVRYEDDGGYLVAMLDNDDLIKFKKLFGLIKEDYTNTKVANDLFDLLYFNRVDTDGHF